MFPTEVLEVPYKAGYIMCLANIHVTTKKQNTGFLKFITASFMLEILETNTGH